MSIWGLEGRHDWYSADALGGGAVVERTNLCTDPCFQNNSGDALGGGTDWTGVGIAVLKIGSASHLTGFSQEAAFGNTSGATTANGLFHSVPVVSGRTYTFSAYCIAANSSFQMGLDVLDAGGVLKGSSATNAGNVLTRLSVTVTATATATWKFAVNKRTSGDNTATGALLHFSGVLIEQSASVLPFFDGDFAGCQWSGTPHDSTSESLAPSVRLNYNVDDAGTPVYPRYKLDTIGGLYGGGDSGDRRDSRVGAQGEIPRTSKRRGKTITYTGLIQAQDRGDLEGAAQALLDAFDDQDSEGLMVVTPHPTYDSSGHFRYFNAKALIVDVTDQLASPFRVTRGHEWPFVVSLRNARAGGVSYYDQDGVGYK